MNAPFTVPDGAMVAAGCYRVAMPDSPTRRYPERHYCPIVGGAAVVSAARELAIEHGGDAALAARLRAAQSRARDNAADFCRWREVERTVAWLNDTGEGATRH